MILASLLHTLFVASLLLRLGTEGVVGLVPSDVWDWAAVAILLSGYGGAFAIQVSGLIHQRAWHLLPIQIILPFYWLLHTVAAVRSAVELIRRPVYWAKTTHGVTRLNRGGYTARSVVAAEVEIGRVDIGRPAADEVGDELA